MPTFELDENLYGNEDQDPLPPGRSRIFITILKNVLIAALFMVPIIALLKPHFSRPTALPTLTPSNGIQVETTDFDALRKPLCTGELCAGLQQ